MPSVQIVISNTDSEQSAQNIADQLVEEHLAACVNIIPNILSVYKWKGLVDHAREHMLIIKTPEDRVEQLTRRLKELHSYELPGVVAIRIEGGDWSYLDWVVSETR